MWGARDVWGYLATGSGRGWTCSSYETCGRRAMLIILPLLCININRNTPSMR
jgi:hypothetical protein